MNFFGLALLFGCATLFVEGIQYGKKTLKEFEDNYDLLLKQLRRVSQVAERNIAEFKAAVNYEEEGGRFAPEFHKGEAQSATLSGVEKGLQKQYGAFRDLLKSGDPELLKSAKKRIEAKLNDFEVLLKDTESKQIASRSHPQVQPQVLGGSI